jgi:hypothetical protein
MNEGNAKQQIVEKVKTSSNILVTVSTNPSVDELSAALGLTILLNKMDKHATAVFSGAIPPAITFLDPEKTFENTVDSLRDFIIALDKEKADHLRYKVDGDVVKIFITPYRTTISSDDLEFSQGDYNVELVLALGVKQKDNLDSALAAHGRILHDATVATISIDDSKSELGSIAWRDQNASSLSEMIVSLSDTFKSEKAALDEQIATALLTGLVAATDRFSNSRTSSRVMTMAATLMAAGANQQLIAAKLEEANEIGDGRTSDVTKSSDDTEHTDGTVDLSEGESTKLTKDQKKANEPAEPAPKADGSLTISHEKIGTLDEVALETAAEQQNEAAQAAQDELARQLQPEQSEAAEAQLAQELASTLPPVVASSTSPSVSDLQADLANASAELDHDAQEPPQTVESAPAPASTPLNGPVSGDAWKTVDEPPLMGGTLNATTEQAAEDERREIESDRNRTILSHNDGDYVGGAPSFQAPLNASSLPSDEPSVQDPFAEPLSYQPTGDTTAPTAYAPTIEPPQPQQTLAELDSANRQPHEDARAAVEAAFGTQLTPDYGAQLSPEPAPSADMAPPVVPAMPPLPDFSTLPPPLPDLTEPNMTPGALPPEKLEEMFGPPKAPPAEPKSNDPGQFQIPGQ